MGKVFSFLLAVILVGAGCVPTLYQQQSSSPSPAIQPGAGNLYAPVPGARGAPSADDETLVLDPLAPESLPYYRDLPQPSRRIKVGRKYTGVIKNKTRYEVSVPSANSSATLVIPARGWVEYVIWTKKQDVTAYRNGKPFYCLRINASPNQYPFMCKRYDFVAEIVKDDPRPGPKKRKIKKETTSPGPEVEDLS